MPKIIDAFKLVPQGTQKGMKDTRIGKRNIHPETDDFFRAIIEERKSLPETHPHYLLLKIIANSLYGIFAELNKYEYGKNNAQQLSVFRWKDPSGQWVKSCSILTTTPNAVTSPVHDRMPVILSPNDYDLWLDPGMTKVEAVSDLLKPYALTMRCFPVSSRVNHVVNDYAACSTPVQLDKVQSQTTLF